MKAWMGSFALVAALAATSGAAPGASGSGESFRADNAGRMLRNAETATGVFQAGLGSGASLEDTASRGFEGQQALLGFGKGAGETSGVDASGARAKSDFSKFTDRHAPGLKADGFVPTPAGFDCHGPGCGSNGGDGGDKGRKYGEIAGRVAGFVLGIVAISPAIGLILSGTIGGIALGAAALAGTWGGHPQGDSLIERIASSPLDNALAKVGGFVGEWTGRGISKATGFVKGLFNRG